MTKAIYQKDLYKNNGLTITKGKDFSDGTFSVIIKGNLKNLSDFQILIACPYHCHTVKKLYRNSDYFAVAIFRPYELETIYKHTNGKAKPVAWRVRNCYDV